MISFPPHKISSIKYGNINISKVYSGDVQVFPDKIAPFSTLEINGTNGTVNGNVELPIGTYRIAMCGGGANIGYISIIRHSASCCNFWNTYDVYGGGGGAFWYGIVKIEKQQSFVYVCGTYSENSSLMGIVCEGGKGGTNLSGGKCLVNEIFPTINVIENINLDGNDGKHVSTRQDNYLNIYNSPSTKGGESRMTDFIPTNNLIALNLNFGKGCDIPPINYSHNDVYEGINATAGYIRIERI